ncbi:uncharacterized protein BJ171DRAFT_498048 [Polychytrium aggregatum]|uniref:uncharacterized protein n=1 Tax=Polychytrium aggregatum TaxID=110093 RepID=UPI0022FE81E2|nr:uncharacterized protein BJ171DRAFT_498048 [Polychytrium aggregatum]KAI9206509.1 hypothetical protein BJ171DRAFT_498048 [Polychytrium aggregatum]
MPRSRPCAPALAPCVSLRTARTTSSFLLGLLCLLALATLSQGQNFTGPNCFKTFNSWNSPPQGIVIDQGPWTTETRGAFDMTLSPNTSRFHFYTTGTLLYGQVSALILGSSTPGVFTSMRLENSQTGANISLSVFAGGLIQQRLQTPVSSIANQNTTTLPTDTQFINYTINWTPGSVIFNSPMRIAIETFYQSSNSTSIPAGANYAAISNLTISCNSTAQSSTTSSVTPTSIVTSIASAQPKPTTTPPPVVDPPATSPAAIAVPVVVVVILVAAGVGFYKFRTRLGLDKFAGLGRQSGSGSSESRSAQPRAIPPIQMLQSNPSSTADPLQNSIQDREMTLPDRDVLSASSDHSATYRADQLSQADIPLSALDPSTGNRRGSIAKLGLPDHSFHDSQSDGNDHSVPAYPESSPNLLSRRHSSSTLPPPYYQSITYVPPPVPEITVYVSTSEPDSSDNTNNPPTTNRESMLSGTTDSVPQN